MEIMKLCIPSSLRGHVINSTDAIGLMKDKTGIFQYDPRIIAYYGNREPGHIPATWRDIS